MENCKHHSPTLGTIVAGDEKCAVSPETRTQDLPLTRRVLYHKVSKPGRLHI
ncbi:hypothetical protein DPMN_075215 [Dreissena polymorpha]|uniref:Uncharacterized protein n=1 Tax=Dreissena polymorpha TaxID=45954 RepID=A0A9D3YGR7_DREPO|nr:hypothetical protein DPMN_075215 [Dreissena polymorpha]